jgi:hypothetical protein
MAVYNIPRGICKLRMTGQQVLWCCAANELLLSTSSEAHPTGLTREVGSQTRRRSAAQSAAAAAASKMLERRLLNGWRKKRICSPSASVTLVFSSGAYRTRCQTSQLERQEIQQPVLNSVASNNSFSGQQAASTEFGCEQ